MLFSIALVPNTVREDHFKRRATKDRLQFVFDEYAFSQRCDGYEQGSIDFLLAERRRKGPQDRGKVEAVVQVSQSGATVIVDDPWSRELAARYDLEFHGTLWVWQRFEKLELISSADPRRHILSFRQRGIRLPWATADALLMKIDEERLPA